jgi:aspartyl-tRNA(Asn)/glutamyl-tRNA(Gln) amidotransferase subunit B
MGQQWLDKIKSQLCELPLKKQMRFVREFGLSDYDAAVLTADRSTTDAFEEAVKKGGDPKQVCNLMTQTGFRLAKEKGVSFSELSILPDSYADLSNMIAAGDISATAASDILEVVAETGKRPQAVAKELNLIQKSDAAELEAIVEQVLAENPKAIADATSKGKKSKAARGFLMGQVMQKTAGRANPAVVSEIIGKKLS